MNYEGCANMETALFQEDLETLCYTLLLVAWTQDSPFPLPYLLNSQ